MTDDTQRPVTPAEPPGDGEQPAAPAPDAAWPAPPAPSPPAPGPVPPPGPGVLAPGGVFAATGDIAPPPAPPKRRGIVAVAGAGLVAVVALFLKFGLPILTATAVSGLVGGMFGGPFEKLPAEQRDALERRFEAAMGSQLQGLNDEQALARVDAALAGGLPRLGDEVLVERIRIVDRMLTAADEGTCATLARDSATGTEHDEAQTAALGRLDQPSAARWFEINISALEAQAAGSPPARTVPEAETDRIALTLVSALDASDASLIGTLYDGGDLADADACRALRALYTGMVNLPPADLATMALYDVTP